MAKKFRKNTVSPSADERLLKKLKNLESRDIEMRHVLMDQELLKTLAGLGFAKSVEFFNSQPKWYA